MKTVALRRFCKAQARLCLAVVAGLGLSVAVNAEDPNPEDSDVIPGRIIIKYRTAETGVAPSPPTGLKLTQIEITQSLILIETMLLSQ